MLDNNEKIESLMKNAMCKLKDIIDVNTVVTTKTVIGTVGGWSTSSSHGGYDNCTSGTHLHFGVTPEWHDYGFNYYSINPRNILAFPQEGYGYFYK